VWSGLVGRATSAVSERMWTRRHPLGLQSHSVWFRPAAWCMFTQSVCVSVIVCVCTDFEIHIIESPMYIFPVIDSLLWLFPAPLRNGFGPKRRLTEWTLKPHNRRQMMSLHITILFKLWLVTSGSCRKHEPIRNSNHNKLCLKPYWLYYIDCSCGTFILCITTLYCHDCFCDQQGNISNKHTENKSCNIKHWLTKPMIPRPLYHLKN
jgi:hypothetical protein